MKALIFVCCAALVAGRTHERSGHHAADGVHSSEKRTRREMRLRMAELRMQHHPMEEEEHGHHNRHHRHGRFMNRHGRHHHQGHGEQAVPQQLEDQQQEQHHQHGGHHQHGHHWGHRVYYFYYRLMHGNSSDSYSMHGPRAVGSSSAFEEGSDPHFDHAHHRAFRRAIHVAVFVIIALCVVGVVACIKRKMKMRRLMRATMMGTGGYVLVRKELVLADDLPVIKVAGDLPNKDVL